MPTTTNDIKNKMLLGLNLHLVLMSKQKLEIRNLIRKHFPPRYKFSELFNHNTIKVSYNGMPNIKAEINKHNSQFCNCTNENQCPLIS